MITKPYKDIPIKENVFLRTFSSTSSQEELVWHRDYRKRKVEVLEGKGWEFQIDNHLPFRIKEGDHFTIEANSYHRLLAGSSDLTVRITEYYK